MRWLISVFARSVKRWLAFFEPGGVAFDIAARPRPTLGGADRVAARGKAQAASPGPIALVPGSGVLSHFLAPFAGLAGDEPALAVTASSIGSPASSSAARILRIDGPSSARR